MEKGLAEVVSAGWQGLEAAAENALKRSAVFWFLTAVAGQWLFVFYLAGFYGPTLVTGDYQGWDRNTRLADGYIAGDAVGNLFFAAHVGLAAVLTFGGALQLVPQIRKRAIAFHRWNGRIFMLVAIAGALAGLHLEWVRGTAFHRTGTGLLEAGGITLNAALILMFAGLAWRAIRGRNIAVHQRWATRLFLVVNGTWFMRVGFRAWMLLTAGAFGGGEPFFKFWSYGAYLLPLAIYELYLRAQTASPPAKFAMAAGLAVCTVIMGMGAIAAFVVMWRPLLFG